MKLDTTEQLGELLIENLDAAPRPYSGRGMHGKICLGFEYDGIKDYLFDCLHLIEYIVINFAETNYETVVTVRELLNSFTQDSLGKGLIIYFPSIPWFDSYQNPDD